MMTMPWAVIVTPSSWQSPADDGGYNPGDGDGEGQMTALQLRQPHSSHPMSVAISIISTANCRTPHCHQSTQRAAAATAVDNSILFTLHSATRLQMTLCITVYNCVTVLATVMRMTAAISWYQALPGDPGPSRRASKVDCFVLQDEDLPSVQYSTVLTSASKRSIRRFVITEKAPTRAFSWLKAVTTAFTFKTLC